jgi:hypothetical protein
VSLFANHYEDQYHIERERERERETLSPGHPRGWRVARGGALTLEGKEELRGTGGTGFGSRRVTAREIASFSPATMFYGTESYCCSNFRVTTPGASYRGGGEDGGTPEDA